MNFKLFTLAICILLVTACSKPEGIKISGELSDLEEGKIAYIDLIINQEKIPVDSFEIKPDGNFEKYIKVDEPGFYRVSFDRRNYINLVLNDEDVEIYKNTEDSGPSFLAKGSTDTELIQNIAKSQTDFESEVLRLNNEFNEARSREDMTSMQSLQQLYIRKNKEHAQNIKNSIWAMDNSIAGILAINFIQDLESEALFLDSLATKYEQQLPSSPYTVELRETADSFKVLAIGADAPEIDLPTPSGENLKLSSFKGKYVLIDFWAAWCGPCRRENPNVVKMYQEYHDKGFEILSVSLDRSKDKWVEAIAQDGLIWNHVSDLLYFNSKAAQTYQINAIPATYLIGPDGKIVAKNLRGVSLEAKLKEIFG
ncbi:TlpA disulfide reductase family protein [Reichenbachiella versicolor]|uniref:TlpA disulfide reductase family protein n=1 Tax=Reichenbachiella versicolor TaxID=1821036 RepID=UPI000D6DEA6F|nr:TlpA disulfide reductase family protein [Reichenbachiella versicolor]